MWPQICEEVRGWPEVVHPRQDCRISPTRHGLYGQDGYGHREREIEDAWSIRAVGTSEKRKEDQPSSSFGKRQKTSAPRVFQGRGRGYQGQGQTRASTKSSQMICYFYHQPGHMRRDWPQRPGSQAIGTVQSQSLMGQAWMQFVPSHPNVG